MSKFFVNSNQIENNNIQILGDDVNHIKNVLRISCGEKIKICNEDSAENYECEIEEIEKDFINCKILNRIESESESNIKITIFQGLPKADKMELIIQKSTELGAYKFVPVALKRCVLKLSGKDEQKKIDRWQKISEVAAKQCGRDIIPKVLNVESLKNVENIVKNYDLFLLAYENEENYSLKAALNELKENNQNKFRTKDNINIGIIIGPEGGLDIAEVQTLKDAGAKVVTLGKRILRTETVALSMTSIIMYELEDFGGNK